MADSNSNTTSADHIGDVAMKFISCSDVFGQISALINIIKKDLPDHTDARRLAELLHYIANDYENFADCIAENILRGGIKGYVGSDHKNLITVMKNELTVN